MLEKKYRLPAYVKLAKASSYTASLFFLKSTNNDLNHSRFGFVVSKKTESSAVARNKIRRVFRSCIEEMLGEIKEGIDLLFVLKRGILEMERKALYNELHDFLAKKDFLK
jgi:ribonuclease P protein component